MLGTAQLGQRYGIANRTGQPDAGMARVIVAAAWERGIRGFDTAPDYGDAERLFGETIRLNDAMRRLVGKPTVAGFGRLVR